MCRENGFPLDRDDGAPGGPIERIAAALGQPVAIFADGLSAEIPAGMTCELLRLWAQVRDPEAGRRILAFVAAVVAEQNQAGARGS